MMSDAIGVRQQKAGVLKVWAALMRRYSAALTLSLTVLGGLLACTAPSEPLPPAPVELGSVQQAFSMPGTLRVIPIRFVHLRTSSAADLSLNTVQYAVDQANFVFRPAGVQFFAKSVEEFVAPLLSDVRRSNSSGNAITTSWGDILPELQLVLPSIPSTGFFSSTTKKARQDWMHLAASRWGPTNEILVWVSDNAQSSQGIEPWLGRGFSTNIFDLGSATNFPHEMGHFLGLAHTWEIPRDPWGHDIPNPETGGFNALEDYWDLIYGIDASSSPVLFDSRGDAVAYTASKKPKNNAADTCTTDTSCTSTCRLVTGSRGGTVFTTDDDELSGITFRFGGDSASNPVRGVNVMSYFGNNDCYNGISTAQVREVRKYLRYGMHQEYSDFVVDSPQPTFRTSLGQWGQGRDPAYVIDFDGDGRRDVGVFRPPSQVGDTGQFLIRLSSTNYSSSGQITRDFGTLGDVPVPADYDGDGKTDIAVWRTSGPDGIDPGNSKAYWLFCPSSANHDCGNFVSVSVGRRYDVPLPGTDFDGDPSTGEVAVYRPDTRTFYWRIAPFSSANVSRQFNTTDVNAVPIVGLFDKDDDKTDLVLYIGGAAQFRYRLSSGNWDTEASKTFPALAGGSWGSPDARSTPYPVRAHGSFLRTLPSGLVLRVKRQVFSLYDPDSSTFNTMWSPLSSSTVTSCSYGQAGDIALGTTIDRDADGRSDMLLHRVRADGDGFDYRIKSSASGTCDGASFARHSTHSQRTLLFSSMDGSGDGEPDLWRLNPDTMSWQYALSQTDFFNWNTIDLGQPSDIPL